jgi:uncharacterized protein
MRTVVDTNVSVSAFLNPRGLPGQLIEALQQRRFTLVISEPMLQELAEVLVRPRLVERHRRSTEQIGVFVEMLREEAEVVAVSGTVHVCRDPDDDMVLETALVGGAVYVVSGDHDTQAREVVEYLEASGVRVLRVREFLAVLDSAVREEP